MVTAHFLLNQSSWVLKIGEKSRFQPPEVYSEPYQAYKMESFAKIVKGFFALTILPKRTILDLSQCPEYTSGNFTYAITMLQFSQLILSLPLLH